MSENERQSQTNAVINNKLQGTVVTYLRCGGISNNQIKDGLLLSAPVKKNFNLWIYKIAYGHSYPYAKKVDCVMQ